MSEEDQARLSASEVACYRWPYDNDEHRALRVAFMDGAAYVAKDVRRERDAEMKRLLGIIIDLMTKPQLTQAAEDVRREREAMAERERYECMSTDEKCQEQKDGFINDYD